MKKYIFFEKDNDLDLEEMGLLLWLKFVYQKKIFSTDEVIPVTSTPHIKIRWVIRRLISKGYVFHATKAEGAYIPPLASKRFSLKNLKVYCWVDTKAVYENPETIQMAR